ncbi:MAG: YbaB/EbfC family nucleoid-associated protein [Pirellulales bacterium]|nr:YbaB/EbfC family nucleoid-associated protein [Pirellulales bacterium]
MGGRMQELNEQLKHQRATGSAGGGMVEIEVNGLAEVLRCRIDENLIAGGDRELIEDLVATAVNQAMAKTKQIHAEAMQSLTGGMSLPGLDEAMEQLLGSGPPEESDDENPS